MDKYTELKSHSKLGDSALFEETGKILLTEGITLRRRGRPAVSLKLSSNYCHLDVLNSCLTPPIHQDIVVRRGDTNEIVLMMATSENLLFF